MTRAPFRHPQPALDLYADMPQVMQHVPHVVVEDEAQGDWWRVRYRTGALPAILRHTLCCRKQLPIESDPKLDQRAPLTLLIAMQRYPLVPVVGRHRRLFLQLSAYDPLMIVGRRIQQVAHFLLDGPGIRSRFVFDDGCIEFGQAARQLFEQLA